MIGFSSTDLDPSDIGSSVCKLNLTKINSGEVEVGGVTNH